MKGGVVDTEKAVRIVMTEFRAGKLGYVTLDDVPKEDSKPEQEELSADSAEGGP